MIKSVTKRDGREAPFDSDKIEKAIFKAASEVNKDKALLISNEIKIMVVNILEEKYKKPSVEDIQDIIEESLMKLGYHDIAKSFILYRERHRLKREKEWLESDLAKSIWENKYRYNKETLGEFFKRITSGNEDIKKLIKNQYFCPAGRILANRKLDKDGKNITLSNCYVNPSPKDDIESIFMTASQLARTFSYGGGSGIDVSNLRPKGAKVNNAAESTSGAPSFMDLFDVVGKIIGQKGRRAALMITMDVDHPDIEEFIEKKHDLDVVTKANISIKITDDFMKRAEKNKPFLTRFYVKDTDELVQKELDSTRIINKIAYGNWRMAEPGVLFWDRVNSWNLLSEDDSFKYESTNPCGEEPLPFGGSCLLSSMNLSEFVVSPFTDDSHFDFEKFERYVRYAVIYLNEVLEEGLSLHPLQVQRNSVREWRQIGLGIMGLADMFIKMALNTEAKNL